MKRLKLDKVDIVGDLPLELSQKVLGSLGGRDLLRCSMVSKKWRELSSSGYLWRRLVKEDFPEELKYLRESDTFEGVCLEKVAYVRGLRSVVSWGRNKFWTHDVGDEAVTATYLANGGIAVIAFKDTSVSVLDFNRPNDVPSATCLPNVLQRLPPFSQPLEDKKLLLAYYGEESVFVFERRSPRSGPRFFHAFKWDSLCLTPWKTFGFTRDANGGLVYSRSLEGCEAGVGINRILGSTLVLNDQKRSKIVFWDLEEEVAKGEVHKSSGLRDFSFEKTFYLCNLLAISGYNTSGCLVSKIDLLQGNHPGQLDITHDDIAMQFSKEVVCVKLVNSGELTIGKFWECGGRVLLPARVETRKELCLHPREKIVLVIRESSIQDLKVAKVEFVCLLTGAKLRVIRLNLMFEMDDIFTNAGHLSLVHYRYILYMPDFDNDAPLYREHLLVDSKSGRKIFHEAAKDLKVAYVGSKILQIIVREKGGKRSIRLRIYT